MIVDKHVDLKPYNTFGISAKARYFAQFSDPEQLMEILSLSLPRPLILGGGSNILFVKDYDGLVLKNGIMGTRIVKEDEHHVYVKVGAGENWHGFVLYCLEHNLGGVENLALIPGNTGASPMQNIGAYGVEIKDAFDSLEAFHLGDMAIVVFTNNDCAFGYRESAFKHRYKDQFAILNVTFRLNKKPSLNTSYGAIEQELEKLKTEPSIHSIARAVINIRSAKLPDPVLIGNAGSFFKNPTVPLEIYEDLRGKYPEIAGYPQEGGSVKLAAGWMIEQCGWKGYRKGDAGCHSLQALVLVNYGHASGKEIFDLSSEIMDSVEHRFHVRLEREVNIN